MIDRDDVIFSILQILSSRGSISEERKKNVVQKILTASEEELETWNALVSKEREDSNKVENRINEINESKIKKQESLLKLYKDRTVKAVCPRILRDTISNEDPIMKELEQILGD